MHEPAPTLRRGRLTGATGILASVLFLPAAYCYACPPPDEAPEPDLSGVHVVPQAVWAAAETEFTLRARVRDESGNVRPETELGDLEWTSAPALFPTTRGATITAKAPTGGSFPMAFTVKASFNGVESAAAHVYVTDGTLVNDMDRVGADHVAGDPPALVLVDGHTSGSVSDTLVAIAGMGAIDYLTCPPSKADCGEVTLFSRKQQVHREANLLLTNGCDAVGLKGDETFPGCGTTLRPVGAPRKATVVIYILAAEESRAYPTLEGSTETTVDPRTAVEWDLLHAIKVLADGWTGITLTTDIRELPSNETLITLGEGPSCTSGESSVKDQLVEADVPRDLMRADTIVVAYVDKILLQNGVEWSGINGLTCPWSDGTGSIVLISWSEWAATTLAHEIVHALGPWFEFPWGHTNDVDGLTSQNIMWEGEDVTHPAPRSLITLGQAFRISLDSYSIFNRGKTPFPPPGTFLCQAITVSEEDPCPRLTKDVVDR